MVRSLSFRGVCCSLDSGTKREMTTGSGHIARCVGRCIKRNNQGNLPRSKRVPPKDPSGGCRVCVGVFAFDGFSVSYYWDECLYDNLGLPCSLKS